VTLERKGIYSKSENLITAFWWKAFGDNKVYVIAEENKNLRIYPFNYNAIQFTFDLKLIVSLNTI
jgi:hypothetical protein